MEEWKIMNEVNLYYIKYNILPNLIALGLAYSYYNKITLNCSLEEYINNVLALFNVFNISIKDQIKLVNNILDTRYSLAIKCSTKVELIKIRC